MAISYTLKVNKNSGEYHLFKGEMTEKACTSDGKSICTKMLNSDSENNVFQCKDEDEARMQCATHGRKVCGICVSDLYLTPTK